MRWPWQIAAGLLLATALGVLLWFWVAEPRPQDAAPEAVPRALAEDVAPGGRAALEHLRGTAARFHLGVVAGDLPPGCAPVLAILAGGRIEVREAPPLATAPGPLRWAAVGVLLPRSRVAALSAAERSSLLAVWSRLGGGRVVRPDQVEVHGCQLAAEELEFLLRWLR